jgi:GT2 family glycosyltransferase
MPRIPYNPLETPERPEVVIDLHDGSSEQVSIIVVHHKRPEYLNMCLQSIHVMSNLNNYECIVVDNGSDDPDTPDYLEAVEAEGVKVVRNRENLYWSAAANQGVAVADRNSKYLMFLHCDTVVLNQSWLDVLINISESKNSGIVGLQLQSYWIQRQKVDFVQEWCMLMTRECWNDCGPWPEELPLVGNAFIMTLRAQYKGYKPTAMKNDLVHHYRAVSFDPNKFEKISEQAMTVVPKLMQQAQTVR